MTTTTTTTTTKVLNVENCHKYAVNYILKHYTKNIDDATDFASDVILGILENNNFDESKASFNTFLVLRIKTYMYNRFKKVKADISLTDDYSGIVVADHHTPEQISLDDERMAAYRNKVLRNNNPTEIKFVELLEMGVPYTEMWELLKFNNYQHFRTFKTRFCQKYGYKI